MAQDCWKMIMIKNRKISHIGKAAGWWDSFIRLWYWVGGICCCYCHRFVIMCFGSMKIATSSLSPTASKIQDWKSSAWMSYDWNPVNHFIFFSLFTPKWSYIFINFPPHTYVRLLKRLSTVSSHWCFVTLISTFLIFFFGSCANKLKNFTLF